MEGFVFIMQLEVTKYTVKISIFKNFKFLSPLQTPELPDLNNLSLVLVATGNGVAC